jgi:phospholipid/cholesterol/gamma-HCH transport system ATP-binding protein
MSTKPVITARHVRKAFGSNRVLRDFNLEIQPQESFVLLGRSGSGKSVFLKTLLGLLPIDGGHLSMEGQEVNRETVAQSQMRMKSIGMVFQGSALFDSLQVWENISFALRHPPHTQSRDEAYQLACDKLEQVGLERRTAELMPSSLSGGMKRRVALARAIALSPRFLFLDEPTAGLDPIFSRLIADLIRTCHKHLGATTLTITHDLHLAKTIADRLGVIDEGALAWEGTVASLPTTRNPLVRDFFGLDAQTA